MIKKVDLAGSWEFTMDKEKTGIERKLYSMSFSDTIPLPGTISQAKKGTPSDKREIGFLTDPYLYEGYAWYAKNISLEENDLNKVLKLYLERTRLSKVWIDDTFVGEFDSLNTPHLYDLTEYITKREFRLTLLIANVDYPTGGGHLTSPDTQTNWNGIIGEISLRIYEPYYLTNLKTFPDTGNKSVLVTYDTYNTTGTEKNASL